MCKVAEKPNFKPSFEMQDIFNLYADEYISNNKLTSVQKKAITDISNCRTSALGYNAKECCDCKNMEFSYNSCRNRNCPKCQGQKRLILHLEFDGKNIKYIESVSYGKIIL